MAKKKKLKHVPEDFVTTCKNMDQTNIIQELKRRLANLQDYKEKKSSSEFLKETRQEIAEYRKAWKKEHPKEVDEFEEFKENYTKEKDAKILTALAELKDLEAGFNESIEGAKEYVEVVLDTIRIV